MVPLDNSATRIAIIAKYVVSVGVSYFIAFELHFLVFRKGITLAAIANLPCQARCGAAGLCVYACVCVCVCTDDRKPLWTLLIMS